MPWAISAAPADTWADTNGGTIQIVAIRIETETGEADFLVATAHTTPEWISVQTVDGVHTRLRS